METACQPDSRLVVLHVDDDHNDMALFALAIEQTDTPIWVQTAFGTTEAIAYLEGKGRYADRNLHPMPNLVLLDLKMHAGDGFEFLERRKDSNFAAVPVVIFTGNQNQDDIERALKLGATRHIEKPMSFKELMAAAGRIWAYGKEAKAAEADRGKKELAG